MLSWTAFPSFKELESQYHPSDRPPRSAILPDGDVRNDHSKSSLTRLFRERNGWCSYSTRLWLALELKNIRHETALVELVGDTFDGSLSDQMQPVPCLQLPNAAERLYGETESSSIEIILRLDSLFPDHVPLLVPPGQEKAIGAIAQAYQNATHNLNARQSPRAGWLFCNEEGYRLDALPQKSFEEFLDDAEECFSNEGPFLAAPRT